VLYQQLDKKLKAYVEGADRPTRKGHQKGWHPGEYRSLCLLSPTLCFAAQARGTCLTSISHSRSSFARRSPSGSETGS
jgi:hypothetical protein